MLSACLDRRSHSFMGHHLLCTQLNWSISYMLWHNVLQSVIQFGIIENRKAVFIVAVKSANVAARVEPEIKEQAESILNDLGIPASTAINMFYRQIILWHGMPFRPAIPSKRPLARDEMSQDEFDSRMALGLSQAKANQSTPAEEVFDQLLGELSNG